LVTSTSTSPYSTGFECAFQHPDRGALAHADDFGTVGLGCVEFHLFEKNVGRAAHRADDDRDFVTGLDRRGDGVCCPVDPVAVGDARSAKLGDYPHTTTRVYRRLISRSFVVGVDNCVHLSRRRAGPDVCFNWVGC